MTISNNVLKFFKLKYFLLKAWLLSSQYKGVCDVGVATPRSGHGHASMSCWIFICWTPPDICFSLLWSWLPKDLVTLGMRQTGGLAIWANAWWAGLVATKEILFFNADNFFLRHKCSNKFYFIFLFLQLFLFEIQKEY